MAYTYSPRIRVTGPAGPAVTYDLSAWQYVTRAEMRDSAMLTEKELLDFSMAQTRYGFRKVVFLEFEFPVASTSNEADLMTILTRALDDDWTVEVSLDSGTTYREAVLSGWESEDLDGKKIGRAYRTTWTCVDRRDSPVAVMGGSW